MVFIRVEPSFRIIINLKLQYNAYGFFPLIRLIFYIILFAMRSDTEIGIAYYMRIDPQRV